MWNTTMKVAGRTGSHWRTATLLAMLLLLAACSPSQARAGLPRDARQAPEVVKTETQKRPQEPMKPYPYSEELVTYENKPAGVKLAATLTLPRGAGPFPAVLLITGSGPQDRDESICGHKPFLVLADYMTRRGVAVLRADDRGVGQSTGNFATATSADFAEDARAGIEYLKQRKDVNPRQIGLMGHSEGGLIAPMLAAKSKDIAYIIMLAGQGLTGEEVLYRQGQQILKAQGASAQELENQRDLQSRLFALLKTEKDPEVLKRAVRTIIDEAVAKLPDEKKKETAAHKAGVQAQIQMMKSPWLRYFIAYDPRPALREVRCPVLALVGSKDLQVEPESNLRAIEQALQKGGNKDFMVKQMPGLNHLFQTCTTGSLDEYAKIEETMAPAVLELIADWIAKRTSTGGKP
jgi:pimeloyl-ACP methyl ester carboxylesterase